MDDILDKIKSLPPDEEQMSINHCEFLRYLRNYPINFSYWFPKVVLQRNEVVRMPKSIIVDVPEEVYRAFFHEREYDDNIIRVWVADNIVPVIRKVFPDKDVFIKNGCFSNKFEFDKSCHISKTDSSRIISDKISNLQYLSLIHDSYGYLELVIREWIEPTDGTKTIYEGMPLRPEIRLFYDFEAKKMLYSVNYWDWDYCHEAISRHPEDYEVYESEYPVLEDRVRRWGDKHMPAITEKLASVEGLRGIWSVDFILEEDKVWLIDMALASRSAYWDRKKAGLDDGEG